MSTLSIPNPVTEDWQGFEPQTKDEAQKERKASMFKVLTESPSNVADLISLINLVASSANHSGSLICILSCHSHQLPFLHGRGLELEIAEILFPRPGMRI